MKLKKIVSGGEDSYRNNREFKDYKPGNGISREKGIQVTEKSDDRVSSPMSF